MKKLSRIPVLFLILSLATAATVFAYYAAHKDKDSAGVLETYPALTGTALDDCALCHRGGDAPLPGDPEQKPVKAGTCEHCHYVMWTQERHVGLTLNAYGHDYLKAGADTAALKIIEGMDSDGDGVSNAEEIKSLTQPGDPDSLPHLPPAPSKIFTLDELKQSGIPVQDQTIFVNVTKSREGDSYRTYKGFLLKDVLDLAGAKADSVTVEAISVDAYARSLTYSQLGETYAQAPPMFGFSKDDLSECGWVKYEAPGLAEGVPLPDANILLAFSMQGSEYGPAEYDRAEGRLKGYGPFRLVAPQMINPGPPDNSSKATPECEALVPDEYNYHHDYEKNSDYCVKSVIAIRVNPMPPGTSEPDWRSQAIDFLNSGKIIVYGNLGK